MDRGRGAFRELGALCVKPHPSAPRSGIESAARRRGIATRHWWRRGKHPHPATAKFPRAALPVTEVPVDSIFAVPFYRDLGRADIEKVTGITLAAA